MSVTAGVCVRGIAYQGAPWRSTLRTGGAPREAGGRGWGLGSRHADASLHLRQAVLWREHHELGPRLAEP